MRRPTTIVLRATSRTVLIVALVIGGCRCGGAGCESTEKRTKEGLNVHETHDGEGEVELREAAIGGGAEPADEKTWFCGERDTPDAVKATLKNGTLRVFGNGAMRDYEDMCCWAPWRGRFGEFGSFSDPASRSITDAVVSEGVTHIGSSAFAALHRLKSVTIHASVSSIGRGVFEGSDSLMFVTVAAENASYHSEDGVLFNKDGGSLLFYPPNKQHGVYMVPNHAATIGRRAFSKCANLRFVTIPGSVKAIGDEAFSECSGLRSVAIDDGVTIIGRKAFFNCKGLTSITIPGSITSIENEPFLGCVNLASVTIEEGVKIIGRATFWGCVNLMSVTIPRSVTFIGDSVFLGRSNLASITILNPIPPSISEKSFDGLPPDVCLYVPKRSIDAYRSADGWNRFECVKPIVAATQTHSLGSRLDAWLRSWFLHSPPAGGDEPSFIDISLTDTFFTDPYGKKFRAVKIDKQGWVADSLNTFFTNPYGKKYRAVKIGAQTWMVDNLNRGYDCYGNNDFNCVKYGSLYSYESAMDACPDGWHLPSRQEWKTLVNATGDRVIAGKKLKSKSGWNNDGGYNGNGTDEFGFGALPGGCNNKYMYSGDISYVGTSHDAGSVGHFWSSDGEGLNYAYGQYMSNYIDGIHENIYDKDDGLSVRCIKDNTEKVMTK